MTGLRIAAPLLGMIIGLEVTALSGIMISRHVGGGQPGGTHRPAQALQNHRHR
jgi:pyridoxal/pyridoxine/pyridoxamine kinase